MRSEGFQSYPKQLVRVPPIVKELIKVQSPAAQPALLKVIADSIKNYAEERALQATKQSAGNRPGWIEQPEIETTDPKEKLKYLAEIDRFLICHWVEKQEGSCDAIYRFQIKNIDGNIIFEAKEDASCNTCCGRTFAMLKITDQHEQEVIHLFRSKGCFENTLRVSVLGSNVGLVHENCSLNRPSYSVYNPQEDLVLRIKKLSGFDLITCGDICFDVFPPRGRAPIGQVHKIWPGIPRETFGNHLYLGISFPVELDVITKALLLGACMFIDYESFSGCCIFTPSEVSHDSEMTV